MAVKNTFILLSLITGIIFSSCVPPAETVIEKNLLDEYSSQEKAELSVKSYLKKTLDSLGTYQPYGFGIVKELIPEQVTALENLKTERKKIPELKAKYGNRLDSALTAQDTLIAQKEREIKTKKIRSFWKISHLYLFTTASDSILAYEVEFTLDPNFKVYNAHSTMYAYLEKDQSEWFDFYYMQYRLFDTWEDESDLKRSQEIYDFYDQKLMQVTEDKGEVLKQILYIISHIKTTGEFSNQKVAEAIIRNEMRKTYGSTYQDVKFSPLKAIIKNSENGEQELLGYSLVHLFKTGAENLLVEKALYFELDPWLIMAGNLPVEPPYDSYFEN